MSQGEGWKGAQHLEAVRMKVREQREAMAATNKELRRLKKTLKTYEVMHNMHIVGPCTSWVPVQLLLCAAVKRLIMAVTKCYPLTVSMHPNLLL